MSLKLIPLEPGAKESFSLNEKKAEQRTPNFEGQAKKNFNPGNQLKGVNSHDKSENGGLKHICLRLIHFINRGKNFTCQQIDELIMTLQRTILSLQRRKQEIMKRKNKRG